MREEKKVSDTKALKAEKKAMKKLSKKRNASLSSHGKRYRFSQVFY